MSKFEFFPRNLGTEGAVLQQLSSFPQNCTVASFHDSLIALAGRELDIQFIASFDGDFDEISWFTRIASPDDVTQAMKPAVRDDDTSD